MGGSTPPTSRDVARIAGVSQTTVSYALTGKGAVSASTRQRVMEVAESIGYRPNLAARSMRTRRSGRLAVITGMTFDNQLAMVQGASEVAHAAGYVTETHSIDETVAERTDRTLELAVGGQYEGILTFVPVLPSALSSDRSTTPVLAATAFDENMHSTGELADASLLDVFVSTLAEAGHRRFLHVAGPDHYASARARRETYLAAVERLGVESLGVVGGEWPAETGRQAVLALPDDAPPLAVIAANDHLAVGVLRGAAERGWTVPGDLVLTGWDNADFGEYTMPSLTTIDVDFREGGRRAMRLLLATLRDEDPPASESPLQRIMWRESTGPVAPLD
ncbi:LacI family DNA-binding transcriptional regulator [Isoptericola halotolerans]|uniref:DNA-binding LacI/PurR family transcriptional regulator n=1 Tax=Isoptericola halotolerans TaxID=300560 RepID=A0ABX1ZY59_9MICO|nr:LacI family DNA-binding transcriptional regulator [Isoptericola halotolerans]NOV95543.1 DNA-binding LacI/PurR family transcriptional regulator [Isoptericola halotolerans]